jgi:hypothetical protein
MSALPDPRPQTDERPFPVLKILAFVIGLLLLTHGVILVAWPGPDGKTPECVGSLSPDGRLELEGCEGDKRFTYRLHSADPVSLAASNPPDDDVIVGVSERAPARFAAWPDENTVNLCGLGVVVRGPRIVEVRDAAGELRQVTLVTDCAR